MFTITVNPTAVVNAVANQTVCNGTLTAAVIFTTPNTGGTVTYSWTNNNTTIGFGASGTGNIGAFTAINTGFLPVTATITVTPTFTNGGVSCVGLPVTFTITVNPTPVMVAPFPGNQLLCNGSNTAPVNFVTPMPGVIFVWTNNQPSIGLAANGTGNIPSFVATNVTNAPVTATVTVTPVSILTSCAGTPRTFTITVNPTPSINAIANQTVCNGATTAAITIGGPVANTVYSWTNNNTSIGLAASGTGSIGSFVAINNTSAPVTATVTVTATYTNGGVTCTATPVSFTITVNPAATVNAVGNQVNCNGTNTLAVTLSGPVAGTTFAWTNSNTAIGLGASGTGNIPSFTATNGTNGPISGTITVTPTAPGACGGTPITFTYTVNPTATVNAVANQSVCNGSATAAVTFTSPTTGGTTLTYSWTNSQPSIGLGASGTGNIPSFVAYNPTITPIVATITVTPLYVSGGISCVGTPRTFTITVNASPNITMVNAPIRVCLTDSVVNLVAVPLGGVWSGPGVVGNTFSATLAGTGVKTLTYTVSSGGCSASSTVSVTVNDCIERHQVFATAIRIYPNPNNGRFRVRFTSDVYKEFNIRIVDAIGRVYGDKQYTNLHYGSEIEMNLPQLAAGTYYLVVYNEKERASFQFEIQR
ncbi:MAG: T9SS type A sorting domain-containing protein [Chitinophagaceae bacterium]|nr:T9SS type A sorting domain-containing protein [Chitinophagaceae bacterium]